MIASNRRSGALIDVVVVAPARINRTRRCRAAHRRAR
jgi:hypothetical protein